MTISAQVSGAPLVGASFLSLPAFYPCQRVTWPSKLLQPSHQLLLKSETEPDLLAVSGLTSTGNDNIVGGNTGGPLQPTGFTPGPASPYLLPWHNGQKPPSANRSKPRLSFARCSPKLSGTRIANPPATQRPRSKEASRVRARHDTRVDAPGLSTKDLRRSARHRRSPGSGPGLRRQQVWATVGTPNQSDRQRHVPGIRGPESPRARDDASTIREPCEGPLQR
jgi:hypothetical protein